MEGRQRTPEAIQQEADDQAKTGQGESPSRQWRVHYKHYHREDSSYQHEDIDAPTPHDAVLGWLLDNAGEGEGDGPTLDDVTWDDRPPSCAALDEQKGFSFWPGGSDSDIFTFIFVEPCRWAICPTCQGKGEVEVQPAEPRGCV